MGSKASGKHMLTSELQLKMGPNCGLFGISLKFYLGSSGAHQSFFRSYTIIVFNIAPTFYL